MFLDAITLMNNVSTVLDEALKAQVQSNQNTIFKNGAKNVVGFTGKEIFVDYPNLPYSTYVMPDITNVRVIENDGCNQVVIVEFSDNTSERAVLSEDDTYSLEYGISVCVTKRLLSEMCYGHGSSVYNKIVKHGLKVYKNAKEQDEKNKKELANVKAQSEKVANKKAKKRAKREAAAREELIEIQKEAYLRALKEFNAPSDVAK